MYLVFEGFSRKGIYRNSVSFLHCFTGVYLVFEVFQARVAHVVLALTSSHKNAVAHMRRVFILSFLFSLFSPVFAFLSC